MRSWCHAHVCRCADADSDAESVPTPVYPASPEATQPAGDTGRESTARRTTSADHLVLLEPAGRSIGITRRSAGDEDVAGPLPIFSARSRYAISWPSTCLCPLCQAAQGLHAADVHDVSEDGTNLTLVCAAANLR